MKKQICYLWLKKKRKKKKKRERVAREAWMVDPIFLWAMATPARGKVAPMSQRHFSNRKERNRREYSRLKLFPAMNFLLKKIRHRLQYPPPRGPTFCTREELMAVRRNLMHPRVVYTWLYRCLSRVVVQLHVYTIVCVHTNISKRKKDRKEEEAEKNLYTEE